MKLPEIFGTISLKSHLVSLSSPLSKRKNNYKFKKEFEINGKGLNKLLNQECYK